MENFIIIREYKTSDASAINQVIRDAYLSNIFPAWINAMTKEVNIFLNGHNIPLYLLNILDNIPTSGNFCCVHVHICWRSIPILYFGNTVCDAFIISNSRYCFLDESSRAFV